ncbi:hypothetical protein Q604_UNBC18048G0001, partial [human gut metagenome]
MGKVKFGLRDFEYGIVTAENKVPTTKKLIVTLYSVAQ